MLTLSQILKSKPQLSPSVRYHGDCGEQVMQDAEG
jgi:hypothetical protein